MKTHTFSNSDPFYFHEPVLITVQSDAVCPPWCGAYTMIFIDQWLEIRWVSHAWHQQLDQKKQTNSISVSLFLIKTEKLWDWYVNNEVLFVPGAHCSAVSRGPTVQWNENGSMHLSKPRRSLRQWESLSRNLPSSILLRPLPDIYLAVRQERQCKSNPPPINYLLFPL